MKYLSLFTGIGGFELGIGKEHECVGFSEIDKYAIKIYQKHFPEHHNFGDITNINENELPDFDLLCGGFPCQSFSIAGKRGGFNDTRGTLFFDIARILKAKQPRLLLLENVKGLLSHDEGRTFATIISTLDELGYDLQWQVLNSKDFGVPQNRERVLIVGHLRGTPRPQVFPLTGTAGKDIEQLNQPTHSNDRIYSDGGSNPTLNTMQGGKRQPFVAVALRNKDRSKHQGKEGQKYGDYPKNYHLEPQKDGIAFTVKHVAHENWVAKTVRSGGRASPHGSKQNWDSYEFEGKIRRLTPTECERLQGFPDGWTEGISDTQRYKTLGNAVTTTVIQAVVRELLKSG